MISSAMLPPENKAALLSVVVSLFTAVQSASGRCPSLCHCNHDLTTVTCTDQKLTDIPSDLPPGVLKLNLADNRITEITTSSFSGLYNLTWISLQQNFVLDIATGAFADQSQLVDLFLTNNKLLDRVVLADVFLGLSSLKHLYLGQNRLTKIPDAQHMPSLLKLVLDSNAIDSISFPPGHASVANLQSITLANNKITSLASFGSLHPGSVTQLSLSRNAICNAFTGVFNNFTSLRSLDISSNPLTQDSLVNITRSLQNAKSLVKLDLSSVVNWQVSADLFDDLLSLPLSVLTLAHSERWEVILNGTFHGLPMLNILDLSYSKIRMVKDGAFLGLDSLQRLDLDNNRLDAVPVDLPPSLHTLDLSHNSYITELSSDTFIQQAKLLNLSLAHCEILKVSKEALTGLSRMQSLDLSHNKLSGSSLSKDLFSPVKQLLTLNLASNGMTQIDTNHKLFNPLTSLVELDMSENRCAVVAWEIFDGLTSLKTLNLRGNKLGDMLASDIGGKLFRELPSLEELNLVNNDVTTLPGLVFHQLASLKYLHLENNHLSRWGQGLFQVLPSLKIINMTDNSISLINETSVQGLKFGTSLDLTNNPFACWCDLVWFRDWVDNTNVTLVNKDLYTCSSPERYAHKPLVSFVPADIKTDCDKPPLVLFISVAAGVLCAVILSTMSLVYRYRWPLRRRWYELKRRRRLKAFHKHGYEALDGEETLYDLCVLYHDSDSQWVQDPLVARISIEEGGDDVDNPNTGQWRVFFEGGVTPNMNALECVSEGIFQSRRSILVLSKEFIRDPRCRDYYLNLAIKNAEERKLGLAGIIVIRLDGVGNLPRVLSPLIDQGRHVDWAPVGDACQEDGRQLFWERLEEQLAEVPAPLDVQV